MIAPTCEASAPTVPGKVCAWCQPGVNAAEGHGVCPAHQAAWLRELAAAGIQAPSPTLPEEPKENHE